MFTVTNADLDTMASIPVSSILPRGAWVEFSRDGGSTWTRTMGSHSDAGSAQAYAEKVRALGALTIIKTRHGVVA